MNFFDLNSWDKIFLLWFVLPYSVITLFWHILHHPLRRIDRAIIKGDLDTVKKCLDKGINVDTPNFHGNTPLYTAAYHGHRDIVELLLAHGADINQGLDVEDGKNPLLIAATGHYQDVVDSLIARGAIVGFHLAALWGDNQKVRNFLEQGCNVNSRRISGMTPLHLAALGGQRETVELLLDYGADTNNDGKSYLSQITPLHRAVEANHPHVVELLIERGANINSHNIRKETPLHRAVWFNQPEMVELLIAKGADIEAQDDMGATPLYDAASHGHLEIVKILLENGARVYCSHGQIPLNGAARHGHYQVVELLISYGASVNTRDSFGNTPYSEASNYPAIQLLLIGHGVTNFGRSDD